MSCFWGPASLAASFAAFFFAAIGPSSPGRAVRAARFRCGRLLPGRRAVPRRSSLRLPAARPVANMPSADGGLVGRAVGSIRERRLVPGRCPCSDVVGGVDGVAVLVDLEVEVAAGRPARVTDLGDGLAGRDARADRYREALQVVVGAGHQLAVAHAVAEDQLVARPAVMGPGDHATGMRGLDPRPAGRGEIDARMEPPGPPDRVGAPSEVRVHTHVDGADPAAARRGRGPPAAGRGFSTTARALRAGRVLVLAFLTFALFALLTLGPLPFLLGELGDLVVQGAAAGLQLRLVVLVLGLLRREIVALLLLLGVEVIEVLLGLSGILLGVLGALDRFLGLALEVVDLLAHGSEAVRGVLVHRLVLTQTGQLCALGGHGQAVVHGTVDRVLGFLAADVDGGRAGRATSLVGGDGDLGELAVTAVDLFLALLDLAGQSLFLLFGGLEPFPGQAVLLTCLGQFLAGLVEGILRFRDLQLGLGQGEVGVGQFVVDAVEFRSEEERRVG